MIQKIKSFLKGSGPSVNWIFGKSTDDTLFRWNKTKGLSLYEVSIYANSAINKRADKVGESEFKLYKGEKVIENDWTELIRRPNEYHTGTQFWKLYQKYKDLFGEAYIYKEPVDTIFNKNKPPKSLQLLRPDLVEKLYNSDETEILGYKYSPTSGKSITYQPDEIIYSFNPDPRYPLRGESLLRSGLRALEVEIQANEYQAKSIKSGGSIDTVIKVKDAASPEQIQEMREGYRKMRDESWSNGTPNEPLFAGGDMDVLRLSLSPSELNYIESKKMTLDDVSILTNTPRDILGLTSGSTYANADAAIRIFLKETIKPLVDELADLLNWHLIPDEFELEAIDPTPENKEQKRLDLETADKVHALTTNEKREELGLDPVPNGDDIYIPINLVPLNRPEPRQESVKTKILKDPERRRQFQQAYEKKLERRKDAVAKAINEFFKDQAERVTGYMEKSLKSKSILSDSFNMGLEIRLAKATVVPVIRELFQEQGQEHLTFLGSDDNFNYTSTMESSLDKRADIFAESINQTTFNQLQRQFKESIELGEDRNLLVERIRNTYDDISEGRAEVIARTETHYALQFATLEASKQNGNEIKIWVHAPGVLGGVRDNHVAMDGKEIPINQDFVLPSGATGSAPGMTGDPAEDVNCMCSMV